MVLDQVNSLPVYLLAAAAGVSVVTGGFLDAVVILGVVAANAGIGYTTESRAEKTIQSLKSLVHPSAEVLRGAETAEIPSEYVVPGDLLLLKPGTYVAADARLLEAHHLSVDESMLTGESMPVVKRAVGLRRREIPLAERVNMVYRGTLVTGGHGTALVVATGQETEIGYLQRLLDTTTTPKTPIERQLERIGDQLVVACGVICGLVFLVGLFRGYGFLQMLRSAISLAAAAVPEGLPAAATINFALGITAMRKHRVLVRHLHAIETIGAVQMVCLDKTGTLTANRMTVTALFAGRKRWRLENGRLSSSLGAPDALERREVAELLRACVLCSESRIQADPRTGAPVLLGSSTENALVRLALAEGLDAVDIRRRHRLIKVDHRSESRMFMSALLTTEDGGTLFCLKGSPTEVLGLCRRQMIDGAAVALDPDAVEEIEKENEQMAAQALRVLGVAYHAAPEGRAAPKENDLVWLGLVGMADPVRNGAGELIRVFHRAGIETVMITGDQNSTAYAVAQAVGISGQKPLEILDSTALDRVDPETLKALALKVHAYSRVSPSHKLKIVQALQAAGKTVAMTGDGINDGPALKAADIGIAMGESGTDVAREVADVILEVDNLESLIIAVRDGRTTYSNIRKSVHFFLSTNFSEIMVMFASMALGIGLPLNVMQLLWINIISDIFPGLALAMEPTEPGTMQQPPRDGHAPLFERSDVRRMTFESAVLSAATLGAYGFGIARYGQGPRAASIAFQALTFAQLLHAFSCRSETRLPQGRKRPTNPYLNLAVGGSLALQVLTLVAPFMRRFLGLTPLAPMDVAVIGASALLPLAVNEMTKRRAAQEAAADRPSAPGAEDRCGAGPPPESDPGACHREAKLR